MSRVVLCQAGCIIPTGLQSLACAMQVTKLPGNKGARKQLGSQIKSLIAQQQEAGAKGAAAPAEKPGNGTMAE
jgi:hypothetical protein